MFTLTFSFHIFQKEQKNHVPHVYLKKKFFLFFLARPRADLWENFGGFYRIYIGVLGPLITNQINPLAKFQNLQVADWIYIKVLKKSQKPTSITVSTVFLNFVNLMEVSCSIEISEIFKRVNTTKNK